MANKNKSSKNTWNRVQDWYTKPQVQMYVGMVYSLGAAVVIVGALFKLMHWPGAGTMLTLGMITEAILFTIGIFEKPQRNYRWENIFPPIVGDEVKPLNNIPNTFSNTSNSNTSNGTVSNFQVASNIEQQPIMQQKSSNTTANVTNYPTANNVNALNNNIQDNTSVAMPNIPNIQIDEDDAKALTDGIKSIKESAAKLANIGKFAEVTETYVSNLEKASCAASDLASKQKEFSSVTSTLIESYNKIASNITVSSSNARDFAECTNNINRSLNSINTAYELQLKEINEQNRYMNALTKSNEAVADSISKIQQSINESAINIDTYKQMTDQLSRNVSNLNDIYGNMLNAIKY